MYKITVNIKNNNLFIQMFFKNKLIYEVRVNEKHEPHFLVLYEGEMANIDDNYIGISDHKLTARSDNMYKDNIYVPVYISEEDKDVFMSFNKIDEIYRPLLDKPKCPFSMFTFSRYVGGEMKSYETILQKALEVNFTLEDLFRYSYDDRTGIDSLDTRMFSVDLFDRNFETLKYLIEELSLVDDLDKYRFKSMLETSSLILNKLEKDTLVSYFRYMMNNNLYRYGAFEISWALMSVNDSETMKKENEIFIDYLLNFKNNFGVDIFEVEKETVLLNKYTKDLRKILVDKNEVNRTESIKLLNTLMHNIQKNK